jgi:hypothetical protein
MKSVDSGTFIVFYYEDSYYYRFSSYFNDFSWFRLDQSSLLKITKDEKVNQLESLYQSYRKPFLETSLEKNTDEVFMMIGHAIKNRENFNSNTVQPSSSSHYEVFCGILSLTEKYESKIYQLAIFDKNVVHLIPEQLPYSNKRKRKLMNRIFEMLTREFSITRFYFKVFQGHECIVFFDEKGQNLYKKLSLGHILSLVDNQQNVTGFLPKREFFDSLKKTITKPYA